MTCRSLFLFASPCCSLLVFNIPCFDFRSILTNYSVRHLYKPYISTYKLTYSLSVIVIELGYNCTQSSFCPSQLFLQLLWVIYWAELYFRTILNLSLCKTNLTKQKCQWVYIFEFISHSSSYLPFLIVIKGTEHQNVYILLSPKQNTSYNYTVEISPPVTAASLKELHFLWRVTWF